tara:strand:+ start:15295 stop:15441 length:147 start_codon:yes stop_codon:yes gene_type:complete
MRNELKVIKEENRDSWYKRMGNRIPPRPEDEPVISWMEYFDLLDEYQK